MYVCIYIYIYIYIFIYVIICLCICVFVHLYLKYALQTGDEEIPDQASKHVFLCFNPRPRENMVGVNLILA